MSEVTVQDWLTALRFGGYRKINDVLFGTFRSEACALGVQKCCVEAAMSVDATVDASELLQFVEWRDRQGRAPVQGLNDDVYRLDTDFDRLADHLEAEYIEWKAERA